MSYIVETDFIHVGLRCVVILSSRGHRCGYVGISTDHPLYGVGYRQKIKNIHELNGKCPEDCFDVHGGITYSNVEKDYPVENNKLWWFGYDCAHVDDAADINLMDEETKKLYVLAAAITPNNRNVGAIRNGVIRNLKYCVEECKKLAEQLAVFMQRTI